MIDVADIIISIPSHGRPTYVVTSDGFDALLDEYRRLNAALEAIRQQVPYDQPESDDHQAVDIIRGIVGVDLYGP